MRKVFLAIAALALLAALPLASSAAASSGKAATVKVAPAGGLGRVIVNAKGLALYEFHKDKGTKSSCYGACAEAWPPLLTNGAPLAAAGAKSSLLGTTKRKDGTTQVTYAGHPVYGFVGDAKRGDANGNGLTAFGAEWSALTASGAAAK
jgi:predicted lipoprotein with Yx(FWY)xxD motif